MTPQQAYEKFLREREERMRGEGTQSLVLLVSGPTDGEMRKIDLE